jgi:hypothetical protein
VQHESLHRGGQFGLPLPERQAAHRIALAAGEGVVAPARWPHWVEYGEAEPTVTFEVEFWTRESLRERKVYDTNWALRRAGLEPTPPGRSRARDGAKTRAFDAVARLTGRGRNLVGRPGLRVDGG